MQKHFLTNYVSMVITLLHIHIATASHHRSTSSMYLSKELNVALYQLVSFIFFFFFLFNISKLLTWFKTHDAKSVNWKREKTENVCFWFSIREQWTISICGYQQIQVTFFLLCKASYFPICE